ncbi:hypothetical protein NRB16_02375 [Pseudomonas sp. LJDD11]|uniref:hypothetical protein n=1 Tax=unclassified Pseudomonas TaxID=196821 RepID=UPI0005F0B419|nr:MULTISPECIES: hypothetical protein [unclassified Pseudomonas]MCO8163830.1 hypothetical protein [Pseudomonas sp. 21LCFQ010]MCQ9422371.1 hypothetical protein [Pseudomonas sp. LJDD11]
MYSTSGQQGQDGLHGDRLTNQRPATTGKVDKIDLHYDFIRRIQQDEFTPGLAARQLADSKGQVRESR